jgi:hypothetical protein
MPQANAPKSKSDPKAGPAGKVVKQVPKKPIVPGADGCITLFASAATLHGEAHLSTDTPGGTAIDSWSTPDDWVQWEFTVDKPGDFEIAVTASAPRGAAAFTVTIGVQTMSRKADLTDYHRSFKVGTAHIPKAGPYRLEIRPATPWAPLNLFDVQLTPLPSKAG